MSRLRLRNCHLSEANAVVALFHRHHKPDRGHKFSVAVCDAADGVRGVAIAGRPKARALDDGATLEVTRVCAVRRSPNVCSMLYGAVVRAARALGYARLVTYTLETESGASLRAAGWERDGVVRADGKGWSNRPGRRDDHPEPKVRWRKSIVLGSMFALAMTGCAGLPLGVHSVVASLCALLLTRSWLGVFCALVLCACTTPERSLVRCHGTASAFDADTGLIAWVEPLTRTHFAACYSPEADLCTVLPTRACTVKRLP